MAIDRGLRLADKRSFPADRGRWLRVRDEIYEEVMHKGWGPERRAFVQAYGSPALDASNLLMPLVFFTAPNDSSTSNTSPTRRRGRRCSSPKAPAGRTFTSASWRPRRTTQW
ncbi:MAG: glycoside hydrolase family 15 protein [Gemmataceae bacterium]|nr:glycoside hydrolase family 15 protein [Gemmataceae bacterium]